jgi:hypothetical protein
MNIQDLETQAEFLAMKREILHFASNRYAGLKFELRDRGGDDGGNRGGLDPKSQLLGVDLVGTCGDVVIALKLNIRRRSAGVPLAIEHGSPEQQTYGRWSPLTVQIGKTDVKMETVNHYSSTEILDLGISYNDVPFDSPFMKVKDQFDLALVYVVRHMTKTLKDLGWRGMRVTDSEESDKSKRAGGGPTSSVAEDFGPQHDPWGNSGPEFC